MKKQSKREWPQNLTAKEIRNKMDILGAYIDEEQNEYEELELELQRRGLKV